MRYFPRNLSCKNSLVVFFLFWLIQAAVEEVLAVTVPDDYPTIQAALNELRWGTLPGGETIYVRPGIYNEALKFADSNKSFVLKAISGEHDTIIDGSGLAEPAIFIRDTTGTINVEGFTISGAEKTDTGGGGVFIQRATVNFSNCMITGNYGYHGGGLQLYEANSVIENSTIKENIAAKDAGGIAIIHGSIVTIVDSEILDNSVGVVDPIASGGGMRVANSSVVIQRGVISGNVAKFAGGGVFVIGEFDDPFGDTTLVIEDSSISNNQVIHDPGAPFAAGGGMHIEGNVTAYITNSTISDNISSGRGGGLNTFQARYEILGTLIEHNHALERTGGGIHGFSQSPYGSSILLVDTVVRGNSAFNEGGISISGDDCKTAGVCASLEMGHGLISNNYSINFAGGIGIANSIASVTDSLVFQNRTTDEFGGLGAGLRIVASNADINGTTIAGNFAANSGGGVFIGKDTDVSISQSIIYNNSVQQEDKGGGLQVDSVGPPTGVVSNTVIAKNSGFQIREQSCLPSLPSPILSYLDNNIHGYPINYLYKSPCSPPGEIYDIDNFNALSPGVKTVGNYDVADDVSVFAGFPLPQGGSVLAWTKTGTGTVEIVNLGNFVGPTGSVDILPACTSTYWLDSDPVTVTGTGATQLSLTGQVFRGSKIIEASESIMIERSSLSTEADLTLKAGGSITLSHDFRVELGGSLKVRIDLDLCAGSI